MRATLLRGLIPAGRHDPLPAGGLARRDTTVDGTPLVLKVAWPHREAHGESTALRLWGGRGAPILHAAEPGVYAVLMERCDPGLSLAAADLSPDDGLIAAATVLRTLWIDAPDGHGLERLGSVCAEWAATVRDRQRSLHAPFDPGGGPPAGDTAYPAPM